MSDKKSKKKINVSGYENKPRETTRDWLKFDAAATAGTGVTEKLMYM